MNAVALPLLILAAVAGTSFLSGILGMAGGMVLMGVLAWVLPVRQAMVLHAIAQFFANGSRAFFHRRHIRLKSVGFYLAGLALVFAGFTLVTYIPGKRVVFLVLGIAPFITYALPRNMKLDFTVPAHAFACGVLSTLLHLTAGVSGSLISLFFQDVALTRHETVATKACTQMTAHIAKLLYFGVVAASPGGAAAAGLPLWLYLSVVPVAVAGTALSTRVLDRITDRQFYGATQAALFVLGAVYIVKSATLM